MLAPEYPLALAGGAMIGAAAGALLLLNGRVAGVTGIVGGVLLPARGDAAWRALFVAGLLAGGVLLRFIRPEALPLDYASPLPLVVAAGLLVGFGAKFGGGCTSGHGVCGVGRFSRRSIVAVVTFIATGAATVLAMRALGALPR